MLKQQNELDREKGLCRKASLLALFTILSIIVLFASIVTAANVVTITTQKTDYKIGESVEISLSAEQGALNTVTIKGPSVEQVFKVISSTTPSKLMFVPAEKGAYSINADSSSGGVVEKQSAFFTVLDNKFEHVDEINLEVKIGKSLLGLSEKFEFDVLAGGGIDPYKYEWNFNDGTVSSEKSGTHLFDNEGDHYVYLKVADSTGKIAVRTMPIKVIEEKNILNVKVKDKEGNAIEGATVKIASQSKSTDTVGTAVFESLGGYYSLTISKDGFVERSLNLEIIKTMDQEVVLVAGANSIYAGSIKLASPENEFRSDYTTVSFKFNVDGKKTSDECKVYTNDQASGWKARESKAGALSDVNNELVSEIPVGTYSWKIKCKDKRGNEAFSEERTFTVRVGAQSLVPETAKEEKPAEAAPQTAAQEPKQEAVDDSVTKGKALLAESFNLDSRAVDINYLNGIIDNVIQAKNEIEAGNDNIIFSYKTLGLNTIFDEKIAELKDMNKQFDYKRIQGLNPGDQDKELSPVKSRLLIAYSKIPIDVKILDLDTYDWFSTSKDLEKVYIDYALSKKIKLTVPDMADLIQRNLFLQKTTNFRYKVYVVEVDYVSGRIEYYTIIRKSLDFFNYNSDNNFVLLEYIPKEIAQSLDDITILNDYTKISDNNLVEIEKPKKGKELEVTYFVKRRINTRLGESTKTVLMITDKEKSNIVTGFAVLKDKVSDKSVLVGFGLVLLVGIVYTFLFAPINLGMQMLKLKSLGLSPSKKLVKQIEEIAILLQAEKVDYAVEIYGKAMATYNLLGESEKIMFYDLISHIFNEINLVKVKNLTLTAFASYKHGDTDGMNAAVAEIERLYHSFDDNYKTKVENILLELEKMLK